MKKLKWILLFIMILLAVVFLFATCKKTKAYTNDFDNPFETYSFNFGAYENTQAFSFLIYTDESSFTLFEMRLNNSRKIIVWVDNNVLAIYSDITGTYLETNNINLSSKNYLYIQFCFDYILNKTYLYYSTISPHIITRQDESPIIDNYILDSGTSTGNFIELPNDFNNIYTDRLTPLTFNFINSSQYDNYGLMQLYLFNVDDNFSQEIDEQVEFLFNDVVNDIPKSLNNNLIDTYYTQGYNAGYNTGYLEGETAGYNRGFTQGYNEGYQDGQEDTQLYQNGYTAGYTAGYSDGEMSTSAYSLGYQAGYDEGEQNGYRNGYQTGYLYGYEQGQTGENAITPAFSVISSVFGVVASVMSIQLFPGITIGLLILVPLFFAVLGLILWIWRRN